jgi:DNA-binding NarL/FixJ family response regulator
MGDQQGMLPTYTLLTQIAAHERDYPAACILAEQTRFIFTWETGAKMTLEQALAAPANNGKPEPIAEKHISHSRKKDITELTKREYEVLQALAQGLHNAQIAEQLSITRTTVNSYLRSIYSKVGVTSRTGAVRYALDHKMI